MRSSSRVIAVARILFVTLDSAFDSGLASIVADAGHFPGSLSHSGPFVHNSLFTTLPLDFRYRQCFLSWYIMPLNVIVISNLPHTIRYELSMFSASVNPMKGDGRITPAMGFDLITVLNSFFDTGHKISGHVRCNKLEARYCEVLLSQP